MTPVAAASRTLHPRHERKQAMSTYIIKGLHIGIIHVYKKGLYMYMYIYTVFLKVLLGWEFGPCLYYAKRKCIGVSRYVVYSLSRESEGGKAGTLPVNWMIASWISCLFPLRSEKSGPRPLRLILCCRASNVPSEPIQRSLGTLIRPSSA